VLLGECLREGEARHVAASNENLPEQAAGSALLVERALELDRAQQPFLDEQKPERAPGKVRLIHGCPIGIRALQNETR
jgi:hypothetical protein